MDFFLLILATLPGLIVCYTIFKIDRYDQEPLVPLLVSFLLGVLVTFPAIFIEKSALPYFDVLKSTWIDTLILSIGPVGTTEEVCKFLVLLVWAYPRRFYNEPLDGIVYAVVIAMGFATVENMLYAGRFGVSTLFIRAFTAVPAHLAFAIFQGYYVGLAKFNPEKQVKLLAMGLLISIAIHGIYDFLILHNQPEWLPVLGSISLYACLYYCNTLIKTHLENSPFKNA